MTQPATTTAQPGQEQALNAGLAALERIKALQLQIHIGLMAGMELVRASPQNNDVIALVNHWAGVVVMLSEAEQLLLRHLASAPRHDLH